MKLRNKITNKICDAEAREDGIYLKTNWADGEKWHKYGLGCLGDNWEYYVGPTEPLIKDEKIRKAVRAWAEAWGFDRVYGYEDDHTNTTRLENGNEGVGIEIDNSLIEPLKRSKCYTIAELCGEEEE